MTRDVTDESVHSEQLEPAEPSGGALAWVVVALVLAAAGIGGWWLLASGTSEDSASANNEVKFILPLEPFVVNLDDPNERAYLRIGVSLGLDHAAPTKQPIQVAPLRDSIVAVLAASKPGDLLSVEGKTKLKEDLLRALEKREPTLGVREVYFTEFLIQR